MAPVCFTRHYLLYWVMTLTMIFCLGGFSVTAVGAEPIEKTVIPAPSSIVSSERSNEASDGGSGSDQWIEVKNAPIGPQFELTFPDQAWWELFEDEHLNHYILLALENNPNLNAARIRIEEAQAQSDQTSASLWPSLSTNPSFNRVQLPDSSGDQLPIPSRLNIYQLPLQASYELDLFGKNLDKRKAAKRSVDAVQLDTRSVEIALVSHVASAYFNLLRSDASVQRLAGGVALFERIDELKRNQHQLGLISYDEVIRADRDVIEAQTDLTFYQQQQALFAHQLCALTGTPPKDLQILKRAQLSELFIVDLSGVDLTEVESPKAQSIKPDKISVGIPSELMARRPDILAQEKRLEQAGIDVRVARKAFLPTINLAATLSLVSFNTGNLFDWNNLLNTQAVNLAQPLFKGGALKAQLHFKKARYQEEVENYRHTILTALKDVEDSLTQLKTAYQKLDNNIQRLSLTQKDICLRENLYQQGLSPKLEVLQAQAELLQYQQLADQGKADSIIAKISLYQALGGGY